MAHCRYSVMPILNSIRVIEMGNYSKRRMYSRSERPIILIVCEGKNTERIYFQEFKKKKRYANINIQIPPTTKTDPLGLVKYAKKYIQKNELELKNNDRAYCVFDCDYDGKKKESAIREAMSAAKKSGEILQMIISNPCFEIWYILHFENCPPAMTQAEAVQRLRDRYIKNYNKSTDYYPLLSGKMDLAIKNAKRLEKSNEEKGIQKTSIIESNPYSTVYVIVEALNALKENRLSQ